MGRGLSGVLSVATVCLLGAGCIGDKSATLTLPTVLAVGAYGAVSFGDTCVGSKADLCSRETVQRIESVTVDPPGMVEIVPVDQVPADLQVLTRYDTPHAVHALAAGSGRVCVQGLFSDGTHRQSCVEVAVHEIAHVTVALACGPLVDGAQPQPLVPAGTTLQFQIELHAADGTPLGGDLVDPIDGAAFLHNGPESYIWSAPAQGGSVTFGSRLDAGFSQTLSTYAPADVTAVHGAISQRVPPLILSAGQQMNFQLAADAGGRRACSPPEIAIRTDTPNVCIGDQGGLTWLAGSGSNQAWFTTLAEGTCHLVFTVPGGTADLGTLDVPYYLVGPADESAADQTAGTPCTTQNLHVCARDRSSVLVCQFKRWALAKGCHPGICDYTQPAGACSDAAGCAACR